MHKKKNKIKVFDFFSGCGGTSEGLREAGMDIVLALDNNQEALKTFEQNIKPECGTISDDIRKVETSTVKDYVDKYRYLGNKILFCGCAPCQPFSTQNKNRFDSEDNRLNLLSEFLRFVKDCQPDFILCENVPGLQKIDKDGPLPAFIENLKEMGYSVPDPQIVHAENYGVPQRRKRLVLIASKLGMLDYPAKTHGPGLKEYVTVRDAIGKGQYPSIKAGETCSNPKFLNHRAASLSELNLKRIQCIKEGQGRKDWPEELRLKCHQNHKGHCDVYGRLEWDKPSVTLTTKCTNISNGRYGHPEQDRGLSVREAAKLQTFPDSFVFEGSSLTALARQVGNAVPVLLAKAFGEMFIEHNQKIN
ncbi:MAG: DNA cytosine methyltransferase [Cyanobacteria bacterium SIG28]|nr:DNA cytosine methyltransferase [Cyanobacteria bacterium SIG28]